MSLASVAKSHQTFFERADARLIQHEALGTWLIGLATVALVIGVIFAWWAVKDARQTRHVQLLADFSQRWESDELADADRFAREFGPEGLAQLRDRLYGPNAIDPRAGGEELEKYGANLVDWFRVIKWPNLLEAVGVMANAGAIPTRLVYRMWGGTIIDAWRRDWEHAAKANRAHLKDPEVFRYFEWLVRQMEYERERESRRPRPGPIGAAILAGASQDQVDEAARSRALTPQWRRRSARLEPRSWRSCDPTPLRR